MIFSDFGQNLIKRDFSALKVSKKLDIQVQNAFLLQYIKYSIVCKIFQRISIFKISVWLKFFLEWQDLALLEMNRVDRA